MSENLIEDRLRLFSWLAAIAALVILFLVVVLMGMVLFIALRVGQNAAEIEGTVNSNRVTICAIRENAGKQLAASHKFLREHPDGIPGIPKADIAASIQRTQDFLDAINEGNPQCPGGH